MLDGRMLQTCRSVWLEWLECWTTIDFASCWLHYRVTCLFLLCWAMLLRATETFEQAIACVKPASEVNAFPAQNMINDVCRTVGLRTYLHHGVASRTLDTIMRPTAMEDVFVDHLGSVLFS